MAHSFSSISTFEKCPREYEARYVLKTVKFDGNEHTRRGDRIHKELENYIKGEPVVPTEAPTDGLHEVLREIRARETAPVHVEQNLAITKGLEPCGFWDKQAYLRGKLDVTLHMPDLVAAFDWKSGKRRNNSLQAAVYSTMLQVTDPGKSIQVYFDYLSNGRDKPIAGTPEDIPLVMAKAEAIDKAEVYPPRPSRLCGWCPVKTCEFNEA